MSEQGSSLGREPTDDTILVGRVASGQVDALAQLYDRHAAHMLGLAVHILGNQRDAEDLLHDVFLEIWNRAASYDPKRATVRTWLLVKVRSRAIDRLRSFAAARRRGQAMALAPSEGEDVDPALGMLRNVERSRALEALATLPEAHREVVERMYLQGWSCSEIAQQSGLPVGTVKSRLARALALLRERFPESGGAG